MNYNDLFINTNLPKPLSNSLIYECFCEYKNGNYEAREKVILHNIRLVIARVVKRFSNTKYDIEELVSVGIIGLIKAFDTFDSFKGIQFNTYASRCIDNEILMFIRKNKRHMNVDSFDRSINYEFTSDDGTTFKDTLVDSDFDLVLNYEEKEEKNIIRSIVQNLQEKDREIIILYFGFDGNEPHTQGEIANKLNITQPTVSRMIKVILNEITIQLKEQGVVDDSTSIKKRKR